MKPLGFTPEMACSLARQAHLGQVDKAGAPYIQHVQAVGDALVDFGPILQIAGYLHDILEDTYMTEVDLVRLSVPAEAVRLIRLVSRNDYPESCSYDDVIAKICSDSQASLIKIADNAHNVHPDRVRKLPVEKRARLNVKYAEARKQLLQAVSRENARKIYERINPYLLVELSG